MLTLALTLATGIPAPDGCGRNIAAEGGIQVTMISPPLSDVEGDLNNTRQPFRMQNDEPLVALLPFRDIEFEVVFSTERCLCGFQIWNWWLSKPQFIEYSFPTGETIPSEPMITTAEYYGDYMYTIMKRNNTLKSFKVLVSEPDQAGLTEMARHNNGGKWGFRQLYMYESSDASSCLIPVTDAPPTSTPLIHERGCGRQIDPTQETCRSDTAPDSKNVCQCKDVATVCLKETCASSTPTWVKSVAYVASGAGTEGVNGRYLFTSGPLNETCGFGGIFKNEGGFDMRYLSTCTGHWVISFQDTILYISIGPAVAPPSHGWNSRLGATPGPVFEVDAVPNHEPTVKEIEANSEVPFSQTIWFLAISHFVTVVTAVTLTINAVTRRRGRNVKTSQPQQEGETDPMLLPSLPGCETCRKFDVPQAQTRLQAAYDTLSSDLSQPLMINQVLCDHRGHNDHLYLVTVSNSFSPATLRALAFEYQRAKPKLPKGSNLHIISSQEKEVLAHGTDFTGQYL